jgi:signal transduction histidine kinase
VSAHAAYLYFGYRSCSHWNYHYFFPLALLYTVLLALTVPALLGDLGRAFNTMAERLREARDDQQQEFRRDKITALGEMSLAMAHEIRNPIGVINSAAQMLDKAEDDPGRKAELVRMIREETARLNGLLRDFQQLARHRRPEFSRVQPVTPLERALRLALAGRSDARITRDYHHGTRLVMADAELLQQAWANLISNALDAIGAQPAVLTLRSWARDEYVFIALEDNGPGIPDALRDQVFRRFFRADDSRSTPGSGLGLSLVQAVVQLHKATIELGDNGPGLRVRMRFKALAEPRNGAPPST